jgi:capsular polysaccharide biosynthesis protein
VFGGPNLLVLLVMALGAAMVVGNVGALVRPRRLDPRAKRDDQVDDLVKPPVRRTIGMAAIGAVAVIWSLATLLTG